MRKSIPVVPFPVLALLAISLLISPPIFAQQAMNNAAVIKLLKAGLSDDLIVNTINASPGKYDTSADGLIALRSAGADSKVISAVLMKSAPGAPPKPAVPASSLPAEAASGSATSDSASGAPPKAVVPVSNIPPGIKEIGVYYQAKDGSWMPVLPETVTKRVGGTLKSVATEGKIKGDVNAVVQGKSSSLSLALPASFILYTPEGGAASEYLLLRFRPRGKDREFRLEKGGELHRSENDARDSVTFDIKNLAPRVYRVILGSELGKGEYGFLGPNDANDLESSQGYAKMYTFSAAE
jgi:hypothetical protein